MPAGRGNLVDRAVVVDGESSLAQGAHKAPVPMEVNPVVGLSPSRVLESAYRLTYVQVVAGTLLARDRLPHMGWLGLRGHSVMRPVPPGAPRVVNRGP